MLEDGHFESFKTGQWALASHDRLSLGKSVRIFLTPFCVWEDARWGSRTVNFEGSVFRKCHLPWLTITNVNTRPINNIYILLVPSIAFSHTDPQAEEWTDATDNGSPQKLCHNGCHGEATSESYGTPDFLLAQERCWVVRRRKAGED